MFPNPLPDLGQNQPLLVSGRYLTRPGLSFPERLALTGKFPNNQPLELPLIAMTMDSLPVDKVCAIQQIDLLTSRFWLTGVEAQKETVIELACEQSALLALRGGLSLPAHLYSCSSSGSPNVCVRALWLLYIHACPQTWVPSSRRWSATRRRRSKRTGSTEKLR